MLVCAYLLRRAEDLTLTSNLNRILDSDRFLYLIYTTEVSTPNMVSGVNISAWSVGSGLLALGLSPREAIGVVVSSLLRFREAQFISRCEQVVGSVLTGILAVVGGWIGEKQHIGFTVVSRSSWGMNGSYFPVLLRVFVGSIWLGLQAYWGGQSLRVLLGAIIPGKYSSSPHIAVLTDPRFRAHEEHVQCRLASSHE